MLVLDNMLEQINLQQNIKCHQNNTFSMDREHSIDFVKIAEKLPKLATGGSGQKQTSITSRICTRLWESLRKSLRESFKMELEFYDQTRQEIVSNFWEESLLMFRKRLRVY